MRRWGGGGNFGRSLHGDRNKELANIDPKSADSKTSSTEDVQVWSKSAQTWPESSAPRPNPTEAGHHRSVDVGPEEASIGPSLVDSHPNLPIWVELGLGLVKLGHNMGPPETGANFARNRPRWSRPRPQVWLRFDRDVGRYRRQRSRADPAPRGCELCGPTCHSPAAFVPLTC